MFIKDPYWRKAKARFITASSQEADTPIQPIMTPFIECINAHYTRLMNTEYHQMIEYFKNTYPQSNAEEIEQHNTIAWINDLYQNL